MNSCRSNSEIVRRQAFCSYPTWHTIRVLEVLCVGPVRKTHKRLPCRRTCITKLTREGALSGSERLCTAPTDTIWTETHVRYRGGGLNLVLAP